MAKFRRCLQIILSIMIALLLSGCMSALWNRAPPPTPTQTGTVLGAAGGVFVGTFAGGVGAPWGAAMGAIWGGSLGSVIQSHQTELDYLLYNGVQVVQVGDDIKIILPTDRFFYYKSPNFNPHYFVILNHVAKFIRNFTKVSVKIAGYTDNVGPWQRNLSLSREQAEAMLTYLWNSRQCSPFVYAVGYGEKNPIANNALLSGQAKNRRIEITLRKIEVEPLV